MKWVLITNFGNPGDEFARIGVERLVRDVDKSAELEYVRRDPPPDCTDIPIHYPREDFDVAVVCSMPGFWSHRDKDDKHNSPLSHQAWEPYNSWVTSRKSIMAGFGIYCTYRRFPVEPIIIKRDYTVGAYRQMLTKFDAVYARTSLARSIFGVESHPCPSIFAGMDLDRPKDLRICNFMPGGAHYPWLHKRESEKMQDMTPKLANVLLSEGYTFVAHCDAEREYAIMLGWDEDGIVSFSRNADQGHAERLLDTYRRAESYIGNRIHGAIVSRSFGAKALCIGYDTRLKAVEDVGGVVCTPKTFKPTVFRNWLEDTALDLPLDKYFKTQRAIFERVARGKES